MTLTTTGGWAVKKEISIGTVVTIVLQSIVAVWFLSGMDSRISDNAARHAEYVTVSTTRLTAAETAITALHNTLQQEVRSIQADRSEINGRLVRIETLLTQMLETQRRVNP